MAPSGLYEALASGYGDENYYLGNDPFFATGRSLAGTQLPRATNDSEALFGPLLQGLLAGGLTGYGRENARQTAWDDYVKNPLVQNIGFEEGSSPMQEAPDGWSPRLGKQNLIMAALQSQIADDDAAQKAERRLQLQNTLAGKGLGLTEEGAIGALPGFAQAMASIEGETERAKLGAQGAGLLPGVPAKLQTEALKETGVLGANKSIRESIADAYQTTKDVDPLQAFNPASVESSKFDSAQASILANLQALWKGPMSDQDMKRIQPMLPSKWDRDAQIDEKQKRMEKLIESQAGGTPILDALGAKNKTSPPTPKYEIRTAPDGSRYKVLLGQ